LTVNDWREIYEFWFGEPGSADHGAVREIWFGGGPDVDAEIRRRFSADYERAATGAFEDWKGERYPAMALVVLLDQFPRNIFRGTARAFAADPLARDVARHIVDGPRHGELLTVEKLLAYLPFEHSEDIGDQNRCVELFRGLEDHEGKQEWVDYAVAHQVIIAEFGRFPHRNQALGRTDTPEEAAWLASNEERFGVSGNEDDAS
jgi:uncharacterized protein (DUF924 family)